MTANADYPSVNGVVACYLTGNFRMDEPLGMSSEATSEREWQAGRVEVEIDHAPRAEQKAGDHVLAIARKTDFAPRRR